MRRKEKEIEKLNKVLGIKREAEGTPERILEQFNKKARAYKLGIIQQEKGEKYTPLDEIMAEFKDEWDLSIASMYNSSPSVIYDAYLVNLSHTVAAHLA